MLCLDARHKNVRVPPQHATNPALRLVLNVNFPQPIDVTTEGIRANLSFGGRRFPCYIPMEALWAAFDPQTGEGTMWPESIPEEVKADLLAQQQQPEATPPPNAASTPRPQARLRRVPSRQQETSETQEESPPPPSRQRGHLRIIK